MKIGIDVRICSEDSYYAMYVRELVDAYIKQNSEYTILLYDDTLLPKDRNSLIGSYKTKKILEKESLDLMIFFDHVSPLKYKGKYINILPELKEVFFPTKSWLQNRIHTYFLDNTLRNASIIGVLDTSTAVELNERLDVHEDKIQHISGFFPKLDIASSSLLKTDIKARHNLLGPYLLYDSADEVHNNFERVLKALKKYNSESETPLTIIMISEAASRSLDIREKVIEYDIAKYILFIGEVSPSEEVLYYTQSLGVIFSSIYESFPFHATKALHYSAPILINDISNQRTVFGESAMYMDPLSIHGVQETLQSLSSRKQSSENYAPIYKNYSLEKSVSELIAIIENIDFSK